MFSLIGPVSLTEVPNVPRAKTVIVRNVVADLQRRKAMIEIAIQIGVGKTAMVQVTMNHAFLPFL